MEIDACPRSLAAAVSLEEMITAGDPVWRKLLPVFGLRWRRVGGDYDPILTVPFPGRLAELVKAHVTVALTPGRACCSPFSPALTAAGCGDHTVTGVTPSVHATSYASSEVNWM